MVKNPAPKARNSLAQHAAEPGFSIRASLLRELGWDGGVLGKWEIHVSPVGTAEVLTQTLKVSAGIAGLGGVSMPG